jgi:integrase
MPNVKFNLKNKQEDETLVILIFRYDGKRLVYSTGQKISPKFWNDKTQQARENSKFPQFPEFNAFLKKIELETQNIYRKYKIESKELPIDLFKEQLNESLGKSERTKVPTLIEFIEDRIISRENSGKPKGSIQVYKKALKHLKGYVAKHGFVNYDNIDFHFLDGFKNYMFSEPQRLSPNYALKVLQNIKMFLTEAKDYGYHNNTIYQNRKFTIKKENVTHVYLNSEELELLWELDLTDDSRLERVRDLFIVGCFTGLRFSDFNKLKPSNFKEIEGKSMIEVITKKTKQKVVIPIHPKVKQVIEKYDGNLPTISNQKLNDYIKEVCEMAGIHESISSIKTQGYNREELTRMKFEMVSSHTARRSFASNAYKAGVPSLAIRSITGHKSESSFLNYIKVSEEEQALLMATNSFFSK